MSLGPNDIMDIATDGIWVLIKISMPIMLVALVVGLAISLIQALTQIQEMTLSFVPKIIAIFFSLLLFLPFIMNELIAFAERLSERMVGG